MRWGVKEEKGRLGQRKLMVRGGVKNAYRVNQDCGTRVSDLLWCFFHSWDVLTLYDLI